MKHVISLHNILRINFSNLFFWIALIGAIAAPQYAHPQAIDCNSIDVYNDWITPTPCTWGIYLDYNNNPPLIYKVRLLPQTPTTISMATAYSSFSVTYTSTSITWSMVGGTPIPTYAGANDLFFGDFTVVHGGAFPQDYTIEYLDQNNSVLCSSGFFGTDCPVEATPVCPDNLVSNPDFTVGLVAGWMGGTGQVTNWDRAGYFQGPLVQSDAGCSDEGYIVGIGNNRILQGIQQTLPTPLVAGNTYSISLCGKSFAQHPIPGYRVAYPATYAKFKIRASNYSITSASDGELMFTTPPIATGTGWVTTSPILWTAPSTLPTYSMITVDVENDLFPDTSIGGIDRICIQDVTSQCPMNSDTLQGMVLTLCDTNSCLTLSPDGATSPTLQSPDSALQGIMQIFTGSDTLIDLSLALPSQLSCGNSYLPVSFAANSAAWSATNPPTVWNIFDPHSPTLIPVSTCDTIYVFLGIDLCLTDSVNPGIYTGTVELSITSLDTQYLPIEITIQPCKCEYCHDNLVSNYDFQDGLVGGPMPTGTVADWSAAYGTPDVGITPGCCDDTGYINLCGNKYVGEAFYQSLSAPLLAGHEYLIQICYKWAPPNAQRPYPVSFLLRASNVVLTSPADPNGTEIVTSPPTNLTSWSGSPWMTWIADADYSILTISATNNSMADHGDSTSTGAIDKICIKDNTSQTVGTICGYKFHDKNGNGYWDNGEPPISNWPIAIWYSTFFDDQTTTDNNGYYCFSSLFPFTYTLCEGPKNGWVATTPTCNDVSVIAGHTTIVNFGNRRDSICLEAPSGMIAWWPLDETAPQVNPVIQADDIAGPYDAVKACGVYGSFPGKVLNSFHFDVTGTSQFVLRANDPFIQIDTGDFSIDAWIYPDPSSWCNWLSTGCQIRPIVSNQNDNTDPNLEQWKACKFYLKYDAPGGSVGHLALRMASGGPDALATENQHFISPTTPVVNNTWQHVAVTVQRAGMQTPMGKFYYNGNAIATFTPLRGILYNGVWTNLDIGHDDVTQCGGCTHVNEYFEGNLDEVEIFNRALSSTEILSLYQVGPFGKCKDTDTTAGPITPSTIKIAMNRGWNMVSLPMTVSNYLVDSVFLNPHSSVFAYEGGYVIRDTLINGKGYWIKFPDSQTVQYKGITRVGDAISLRKGWNIVGSISEPILVTRISSVPPGLSVSQFFGYNNGYYPTDTIQPGKGYWVKINQAGILLFSSDTGTCPTGALQIVATKELPPSSPENGIINNKSGLPDHFELEQNYPNPFNGITIIKYQLPVDNYVTLKIFNILGQEIATLVNGIQNAGYKSAVLNASNLPSGIYIYKIQAGDFIDVKKLILMK